MPLTIMHNYEGLEKAAHDMCESCDEGTCGDCEQYVELVRVAGVRPDLENGGYKPFQKLSQYCLKQSVILVEHALTSLTTTEEVTDYCAKLNHKIAEKPKGPKTIFAGSEEYKGI